MFYSIFSLTNATCSNRVAMRFEPFQQTLLVTSNIQSNIHSGVTIDLQQSPTIFFFISFPYKYDIVNLFFLVNYCHVLFYCSSSIVANLYRNKNTWIVTFDHWLIGLSFKLGGKMVYQYDSSWGWKITSHTTTILQDIKTNDWSKQAC